MTDHSGVDSDLPLIEAVVRSGDERAFRELHRRHAPAMYRALLRLMAGDEAEAQDALQDAWISAVRALPGFRREAALRSWLVAIAYRQGCNRLRSRHRLRWDSLTDIATSGESDEVGVVDLERAIARLPAGARTVFLMHDVEGWTHEEIADKLGIVVGTTKSQLFEARKRLRMLLDGHMGGVR